MRLDPGLTLLRLAPDTVQIGSGSRSIQLSGCPAAALAYLDLLAAGITDGKEAEAARACGWDPAEARSLEAHLASVLRPHTPHSGRGGGHAADLLAEDLGLALALDAAPDPAAAERRRAQYLDRRRRVQVQVQGLGRTGLVVARVLASAGIGRLAVWDRFEVAGTDLGTGFQPADLGRSRAIAAAHRIDDVGLETVVLPLTSPIRPGPGGDVTVLATRGAVDYEFMALARAADHPVLPVVARDDDVLIGPWLAPGLGGCPWCWDLAAHDADPHRTARNHALAEHRAGREDVALATAAGALAARQVVRWAETGAATAGVMMQLRGDAGQVDTLTVPTHPDCGCRDAATAGISD
jgi:bacteriocin biosynthesis cyclodehydratase domain-containing protein